MSDGKDNIGSFFKKSFEDFEDLPSKDLWKDISSQIPTYEIGAVQGESLISEAAKTTVSSGSKVIQTIGVIITKKVIIISGAVIMATVGSYIAYNTLSSEGKEGAGIQSVSPAVISDSSIVETQEEKVENTLQSPSQTSESRSEEVVASSPQVKNEERIEKSNEAPAETPLKIDSIQKVEHVAAPKDTMSALKEVKEVVEEKKPAKKETFYEKNAKKHKDSSRNVFSPE